MRFISIFCVFMVCTVGFFIFWLYCILYLWRFSDNSIFKFFILFYILIFLCFLRYVLFVLFCPFYYILCLICGLLLCQRIIFCLLFYLIMTFMIDGAGCLPYECYRLDCSIFKKIIASYCLLFVVFLYYVIYTIIFVFYFDIFNSFFIYPFLLRVFW